METATAKALEKSIAHWQKNLNCAMDAADVTEWKRLGGSYDELDCALCKLFGKLSGGICTSCPVKLRTGISFCNRTPYWGVLDRAASGDILGLRMTCKRELDFLKSLIPNGRTK